ncbi:MAG TPA: CHAD domain-containing protein [Thermoanaerobaculia bacterium]|nr:CHAD domain-containing protein [Thermoanaerobaculia bacterium]
MSVQPDAVLLGRPAAEAVRRLALRLLDEATAAHARLADPADAEALHDFRVAVRRLRSTLRAYRPALAESLSKKLERALKRLGEKTGAGRDAEVQLAWLRAVEPELPPYHRAGGQWLAAKLEERRRDGYTVATDHLARGFAPLADDLRRRLGVYRAEVKLDGSSAPPPFAATAGEALRAAAADLGERLAAVHAAGDVAAAHQTRIAGKRLRYLLEPLGEEVDAARALVKRLKGLQELLGELHDAHVFEEELAEALAAAAAERAHGILEATLGGDPAALRQRSRGRTTQPGLLALARRNRARRDDLFRRLDEGWLGGRAEPLLEDVEALAQRLEGGAALTPPDPPARAPAA